MLEYFMGPEEFRTGIYNFLSRYEYGNAVTADLWRELELASSQHLNIRYRIRGIQLTHGQRY
jgi:aminopeptidase N